MTTLKTTKEQHDNWRHYSAEKLRLMLGKEDIDNLCHDADRARELGEENADLHANLDRYTRIAESGKSYGDDLDNIERIGELELEATQDALDIERALSGQRLLYNRPLAIRVADLRAKLKEQQAASNNLNERLGNCKQSAKEGWRYAYELEQELKKLKETSMKIFKCEAQCDTMYFKAKDVNAAGVRLIKVTGEQIPEELLTWTEVEEVPDGEEAL